MKTNYSDQTMLDMIFENRNKAFGAYVLRRDANEAISRALIITVSSVFLMCFGNFIREHMKAAIPLAHVNRDFTPKEVNVQKKKIEITPPTPQHTAPPAPRQTDRNPEMRAVAQAQAPDSVPENNFIVHDPGLTTTNPVNSNPLGTPGGTGNTIGGAVEQPPVGPAPVPDFAEVMPSYPGGEKALMKFLAENTEYPEIDKQEGIGGKVLTQFTVNEDGSVSDIKILKSPGPRFEREVTRVIKILHPFKPGTQQGKAVKVHFVLPFTFKTND